MVAIAGDEQILALETISDGSRRRTGHSPKSVFNVHRSLMRS
jgi:hypothetical protein